MRLREAPVISYQRADPFSGNSTYLLKRVSQQWNAACGMNNERE
jgi:hypothetical protein